MDKFSEELSINAATNDMTWSSSWPENVGTYYINVGKFLLIRKECYMIMFNNKKGVFCKTFGYKMGPFKLEPAYSSDESIINALAIFKSLFMKIKWDF